LDCMRQPMTLSRGQRSSMQSPGLDRDGVAPLPPGTEGFPGSPRSIPANAVELGLTFCPSSPRQLGQYELFDRLPQRNTDLQSVQTRAFSVLEIAPGARGVCTDNPWGSERVLECPPGWTLGLEELDLSASLHSAERAGLITRRKTSFGDRPSNLGSGIKGVRSRRGGRGTWYILAFSATTRSLCARSWCSRELVACTGGLFLSAAAGGSSLTLTLSSNRTRFGIVGRPETAIDWFPTCSVFRGAPNTPRPPSRGNSGNSTYVDLEPSKLLPPLSLKTRDLRGYVLAASLGDASSVAADRGKRAVMAPTTGQEEDLSPS
jgi:hypothetical protein